MRLLLVPLCLLAGCDVVFGLSGEVVPRDAEREALPGRDELPDGPAPCSSIDTCGQSITHDEDGDCTADPCDLCPHVRGMDIDSDSDGIGDRCDVFTPGPSSAYFESFAATTSMNFFPAASWTLVDDTLQAAAPTGTFQYAVHPISNTFPYEVRARVDLQGQTTTRGIAFNLNSATAPTYGYFVTVTRDGSLDNTVAIYIIEYGVLLLVASSVAVPGDVIDLQIVVGAQLAVTTINPTDETDRIGPFMVTPDDKNYPVSGGTYDGLVTNGPGPRFAYWYRTQ